MRGVVRPANGFDHGHPGVEIGDAVDERVQIRRIDGVAFFPAVQGLRIMGILRPHLAQNVSVVADLHPVQELPEAKVLAVMVDVAEKSPEAFLSPAQPRLIACGVFPADLEHGFEQSCALGHAGEQKPAGIDQEIERDGQRIGHQNLKLFEFRHQKVLPAYFLQDAPELVRVELAPRLLFQEGDQGAVIGAVIFR